jgi:hypothetical protein
VTTVEVDDVEKSEKVGLEGEIGTCQIKEDRDDDEV